MDWDKIVVPEIKNRTPKTGALSDLDYLKLVASAKILRKSVMGVVQTAILCYLARNWQSHEERIKVEAQRMGIEPEELFQQLVDGNDEGLK